MSLLNRIKVKIRSSQNLKIEVKEKDTYVCRSCKNHYNEYFQFCPQCLGEVTPNQPKRYSLKITAIHNQPDEIAALLKKISANSNFEFGKPLRSLPWTIILNSDPAILQQWKDVLEGNRLEVTAEPTEKKRAKGPPPLFATDAPPPFFFQPSLVEGVRQVASSVKDAALRLRWAETVLLAHQLLQQFYRGSPSDRIVFSDFLFEMEHQVRETVREYNAEFRSPTYLFTTAIDQLQESLHKMQAEIDAVKKQVEDQL